ncbi:hypothetical protein FACS1894216_19410 [Synergistales bacterium]|nr:hypothetical protein FACS1894216_19410 [Synergistales bacterium]
MSGGAGDLRRVAFVCLCVFLLSGLFVRAAPVFAADVSGDVTEARSGGAEEGFSSETADAVARANSLFQDGNSDAAYHAYLAIIKEDPENSTALWSFARASLRSGRPHQAIWAYDILVRRYPEEKALYGEMAQTYVAIGDRDTADTWLSRDMTMNDGERAAALDKMAAAAARLQIRKQLRVGFMYDSNANQGPGSDWLAIDKWIVTSDSLGNISTGGLYLGGGVNMSYRIKEGEPYYYVGDVAFSARYGFSGRLREAEQEHSQWYRAAVGIRRLTGSDMIDFRVKGEIYDYDFYNTVYSYGAEITYSHRMSKDFQVMTRAGVERREYVRQDERAGTYGYIGEYGRWAIGGGNEFNLGARYIFGRADLNRFSYNALEGQLGFRFKMERFELLPTVRYVRENYDGPATALEGKDRTDTRWIINPALVYPINERVNFEASYSYTDNDSESPFYKYDRHMINLGWVWNF